MFNFKIHKTQIQNLNFSSYIAKRYLFSKKSHNIINIISGISIAGVTIGTMALIVALSVFNGFENLVTKLFNSFNPDFKITIKEGKTFNSYDIPADSIRKIPGVAYYTEVVEEDVLLKYKSKQDIVTVKGVSKDFKKMTTIDSMMVDGDFILKSGEINYAVLGYGIAYKLGISLNDFKNPIYVYVPRRTQKIPLLNPEKSFNLRTIYPSGIFSIQQDFDYKYMIVPLSFARDLLEYKKEVTAVEIGLRPDANMNKVQNKIQKLVGDKYYVKNRFQQQKLLFKIMKSEKLAVYLILTFILLIAAFNIIGSLSMLILDKKKDISVLRSMGANNKLIKKIFFTEGLMISLSGAILGLILGLIICLIQQKYGIVPLTSGENSFIIKAYPVHIKIMDFVYVLITVFLIGVGSAWYPVKQISKKYMEGNLK